MVLSTLKGNSLAPYLPKFIWYPRSYQSVEHYLEEQFPICLSNQWLHRYYTQQWVPEDEVWSAPPYPPFFHLIAKHFRTEVENVVNNITLVMTLGTLDELLSSDPDGIRAAFDNMHTRFDVRYTSIMSVMQCTEIPSYNSWKDEHLWPGYTYHMNSDWKPVTTFCSLQKYPDASGAAKSAILVARSDLPCPKLEIYQTFEKVMIKHWLGKLLPLIYDETRFDMDVQVSESVPELSIVVWLRVICRHCDPKVFMELLVEEELEQQQRDAMAQEKKRKRKTRAARRDLASFTKEIINSATALPVPAVRPPSPAAVRLPTPMPSPRRVALLLDEDFLMMDEEGKEGRISLAMAFFWDIVTVAFAIFIGFAASNSGAWSFGA